MHVCVRFSCAACVFVFVSVFAHVPAHVHVHVRARSSKRRKTRDKETREKIMRGIAREENTQEKEAHESDCRCL